LLLWTVGCRLAAVAVVAVVTLLLWLLLFLWSLLLLLLLWLLWSYILAAAFGGASGEVLLLALGL